jgi:hypothetical protein
MKHKRSNIEFAGEQALAASVLYKAYRDLSSKNECVRRSAERFWLGRYSSLDLWCQALNLDPAIVRQRVKGELDQAVN